MTAPDTTPATVAEPGATMTVDLPEAIDDAILAALRAARAFGAASELATAAEAHGLDGGPFWASEVRASEAVDTARFALRQAIADALAAAEHRRLAEAGARVAETARRKIDERLKRDILAADLARVTAERDAAVAERDLCAEFAVRPLPADMVEAICAAHEAAVAEAEARGVAKGLAEVDEAFKDLDATSRDTSWFVYDGDPGYPYGKWRVGWEDGPEFPWSLTPTAAILSAAAALRAEEATDGE